MDGTPLTRGDGPGHFAVSGNSRVRVEWQFGETGPSVHQFGLKYVARGVVYRDGDRDVVRWQLLPGEHRYQIDQSRSTISAPIAPSEAPISESRRVGGISRTLSGREVTLVATALRQDGWVLAEMRYPAGSLVSSPPGWQSRHATAAALAPRWEMAAAALFIGALLILFVIRQGYDAPSFERVEQATSTEPPEALPVALAAALAAKGGMAGFPAAATLLDLADRGVLTIHELPRRFGVRNYAVAQVPGKHDLADHEAEALTIAFAGSGDAVPLSKARGRLARGGRRFAHAVISDLVARGLVDPSRKAVRDRLIVVSIAMLFAGGLGAIGVAALIPRYDGWPFMLPLARRDRRHHRRGDGGGDHAAVGRGIDAERALARIQALLERRGELARNQRRRRASIAVGGLRHRARARVPVVALPEEASGRRAVMVRRRGERRCRRRLRGLRGQPRVRAPAPAARAAARRAAADPVRVKLPR